MANIGDYVQYDGLIYQVTDVDETNTTLQPMRSKATTLTKTITSSQKQFSLVDLGTAIEVANGSVGAVVSAPTATAQALADGYVRVKFVANGGSATDSQIKAVGAKVTEPTDPTKTGYTFDAWYSDSDLTEAWTFATDELDEDLILYAKWTINSYTVTFDSNGGSAVASQTIEHNGNVVEPDDPTLAESTFDGWYTDDGTFADAWVFATDVVTSALTLYAKWV